jgi:hypothetical protein
MPATFDYYPFDSGLGANSTESRWRNMMHYMKSTGIIAQGSSMANPGNDCDVSAGTGMSVNIDIGKAWIRGHMFEHTGSATSLAIASNSSGSTRTDLVVLRNDFVGNTIQYLVLQGTTTPVQSSTVWDLPLATVAVPNAAASSASFTITDKRVFATPKSLVPSIKRYSTTQSVPNNAYTSLNLNTGFYWQTQDTMYPGVDQTKIIAPQDGFYMVYGRIQFAAAGTNSRRGLKIMGNGTDLWAINQIYAANTSADISCSAVARLFAGDYLQVQGLQDSGAAINANVIELSAHWLSAQSIS